MSRRSVAWVLGWGCVVGLASPAAVYAQEDAQPAPAEQVVVDWLVVAPLDQRGRRPFNPDAVFAAPPPPCQPS